jgi:2-desacetyl-2-hydroxyethyl bacteriochlorophyllide A dehydrogenase
MRALVVTGPNEAHVEIVSAPVPVAGQVVVDVERVGICGTDVELFTGEMAYLHDGNAGYPIRLGHEWCGTVSAVGTGVDPSWIGRRVTGDTMLGCRHCRICLRGQQHLCPDRFEIGVRGGWPGALAEQLVVPETALHVLPDEVGVVAGALVEPAGTSLRAVQAAAVRPDCRIAIWGPGTIGLLAAQFAMAAGAEVHLVGQTEASLANARALGVAGAWTRDSLPAQPYDAVIDATNAPDAPAAALELVSPGGRVVYVGLAGTPSAIDTRTLVFKDATAVGILSGSGGLRGAIEQFACGAVDPTCHVAATIGLDQVADALAGWRPVDAGPGPKIHIDPRA